MAYITHMPLQHVKDEEIMRTREYRFQFEPRVSLAEAEMSLHLAMFAVEGLIGRARVRLGARYYISEPDRTIVVNACKPAGKMIARVFTGLLLREFGEDAFSIERINQDTLPQTVET
jgi:hypothetical protein